MTNIYRYLVVGLFLLCMTFLVISVRTMQGDIDRAHKKLEMMDSLTKLHFNTMLTIRDDVDELLTKQEEIDTLVNEHEELIMSLERQLN